MSKEDYNPEWQKSEFFQTDEGRKIRENIDAATAGWSKPVFDPLHVTDAEIYDQKVGAPKMDLDALMARVIQQVGGIAQDNELGDKNESNPDEIIPLDLPHSDLDSSQ